MSVKRPGFLWIAALIVGSTLAAASASLLPPIIGILLGSLIVIGLLTSISLLHRANLDELHLVVYAIATIASATFFFSVISPDFGPVCSLLASSGFKLSWVQVGFFAAQQACYFGVHAFFKE